MKSMLPIAVFASLAACQTISEVIPAGPNTYLVGATEHGGRKSHAEVTALGIKKGNEFCAAKGLRFEIVSASNSGTPGWTAVDSQVMFRCVAAQ